MRKEPGVWTPSSSCMCSFLWASVYFKLLPFNSREIIFLGSASNPLLKRDDLK